MEERCYMPIDVSIEEEIIKGYGKAEIIKVLKTSAILISFALLLSGVLYNIYIAIILVIIAIAISCGLHRKDSALNLTPAEQIKNIIRFFNAQKVYHYKYYDEWERDKCEE